MEAPAGDMYRGRRTEADGCSPPRPSLPPPPSPRPPQKGAGGGEISFVSPLVTALVYFRDALFIVWDKPAGPLVDTGRTDACLYCTINDQSQ